MMASNASEINFQLHHYICLVSLVMPSILSLVFLNICKMGILIILAFEGI